MEIEANADMTNVSDYLDNIKKDLDDLKESVNDDNLKSKIDEIREDVEYIVEEAKKCGYDEGYKTANKDKEFDPLGMKNINFSIFGNLSDDERKETFKKQRLERGFDESELWNLDTTILKFILPRLKEFKLLTSSYPYNMKSLEEWQEELEKIIDSMEKYIEGGDDQDIENGLELLKKYFFDLWW